MDDDRLVQLYKKYGRVIFARCCALLRDTAAAEDATQEIFLRVASHLDRAPTSVEGVMWIYRVATNYCLNELRSRKRLPGVIEDADLEPGELEPERAAVNRDLARRIIRRVPEKLRVPVWLYHVDGMTHEEVGKALGMSRRTVINYLEEFRERTRKFLDRAS